MKQPFYISLLHFKDRIRELLNNSLRTTKDPDVNSEDAEENFFIEKHSSVPTLGTRVRRGPHWTFQNQDSEGAGTVVGHGDLGSCLKVMTSKYT